MNDYERMLFYKKKFIEVSQELSQLKEDEMAKRKWKGTFNYQGELHELWTSAFHKIEAESIMLTKLARKLNITTYAVRNYFLSKPQSYEVTESASSSD